MKGDLVCIDGKWRRVVSETIITASVPGNPDQTGVCTMTTFQYTAVRTAPIPYQERKKETRIVSGTI